MASSKFSVGRLLASGLMVGAVLTACSGKEDALKPGPTTAGSGTGGSNLGGSAVTTSGAAGASGGTTAGGSGGAATGMPPIGDKCGANSVKHPDGLCYCQPATLSACVSGCGDFQTDADRCGNCDTKCGATQACRAGKCTPEPTVVVPAAAGCGSIRLAVAAGTLYWTDKMHGTVQSIATTGGTAKSLVTAQMAPTQIAVNGTALYWLAGGSKSIMTATLAGATPTAVMPAATAEIGGFTFSEDGKTLYFSAGTVVSKTTAAPGGTPTEVGHEESGIPHALAVSGGLIAFPADLNGDVDIMTLVAGTPSVCASPDSTVATNTSCLRVARSQGNLYLDAVYIVGGKAYWLNGTQVVSSPAMGTPSNDTIATAANPNAVNGTTMAIIDGQVYFADDVGSIYQAPLMINAPVATLARGQMKPSSITADASNVYWANSDCSIMSTPLK
jgi:hypothetical protein